MRSHEFDTSHKTSCSVSVITWSNRWTGQIINLCLICQNNASVLNGISTWLIGFQSQVFHLYSSMYIMQVNMWQWDGLIGERLHRVRNKKRIQWIRMEFPTWPTNTYCEKNLVCVSNTWSITASILGAIKCCVLDYFTQHNTVRACCVDELELFKIRVGVEVQSNKGSPIITFPYHLSSLWCQIAHLQLSNKQFTHFGVHFNWQNVSSFAMIDWPNNLKIRKIFNLSVRK